MEINRLYNYAAHIIRPQNTESGELALNDVGGEIQDNNEIILHNTIINSMWNQISDMIQGFTPSSRKFRQCHLNEFQHSAFLEINDTTIHVKKGSIWYGWLTAE